MEEYDYECDLSFESDDNYDEGCYVDEFCGDRDYGSGNNFDGANSGVKKGRAGEGSGRRRRKRRRSRHHQHQHQQRQSQQIGGADLRNILAEFPGNHPVLRALRAISKLSHAAFMAIWLAVVLVNSILGFIARVTVVAIEVVCAMLDWVGADY